MSLGDTEGRVLGVRTGNLNCLWSQTRWLTSVTPALDQELKGNLGCRAESRLRDTAAQKLRHQRETDSACSVSLLDVPMCTAGTQHLRSNRGRLGTWDVWRASRAVEIVPPASEVQDPSNSGLSMPSSLLRKSSGHSPHPTRSPCVTRLSLLTLSWVAEVVLTSQIVDTSLRLSTCTKSGVSGMSDRESTEDEKMEALERSSRHEGS